MTRVMTLGLALGIAPAALTGCDNTFPKASYSFSPDQKQAFEKEYPFVMPMVLDGERLRGMKLTIGQLKGADGWKTLSSAVYGTDQFGEMLRELNGHAPNPMATLNNVRGVFCGISDQYCSPVVKMRARSMGYVPAPQKPAANDTGKAPVAADSGIKTPPVSSGSSSSDVRSEKVRISVSPSSARAGTEGRLTIKVTGDIKEEGVPSVSSSGIELYDLQVASKNSFSVAANLVDARPGNYIISISVGGKNIGSASFSVLPPKEDNE